MVVHCCGYWLECDMCSKTLDLANCNTEGEVDIEIIRHGWFHDNDGKYYSEGTVLCPKCAKSEGVIH